MKRGSKIFLLYYFYCFVVGMLGLPIHMAISGKPEGRIEGMASVLSVLGAAVCLGPVFRFQGFRQMCGRDRPIIFQFAIIFLFCGFCVSDIIFPITLGIVLQYWISAPEWFWPLSLIPILVAVIYLDVKLKKAFEEE